MTSAILRRNSSKQGLQNLIRLTAQWSLEDEEEAARERRRREREKQLRSQAEDGLNNTDFSSGSGVPAQENEFEFKPSGTSELEEDEGFSDWSQKLEQRKQKWAGEGAQEGEQTTPREWREAQEAAPTCRGERSPGHSDEEEDSGLREAEVKLEQVQLNQEGPEEIPGENAELRQEQLEIEEHPPHIVEECAQEEEDKAGQEEKKRRRNEEEVTTPEKRQKAPSTSSLEGEEDDSCDGQSPVSSTTACHPGRAASSSSRRRRQQRTWAQSLSLWNELSARMCLGDRPMPGRDLQPYQPVPGGELLNQPPESGGPESTAGSRKTSCHHPVGHAAYPGTEGDSVLPGEGDLSFLQEMCSKITDRTESLNRSIKKSNSVKKTQPPLPVSKIDERLEQYTHAIETSGKAQKLARQSSLELATTGQVVASTKSLWETGEMAAQSSIKSPSCKDIVPGDIVNKRSLWEQKGSSKAEDSIKTTPSGKKYKFVATGHGQYKKVLIDDATEQ